MQNANHFSTIFHLKQIRLEEKNKVLFIPIRSQLSENLAFMKKKNNNK